MMLLLADFKCTRPFKLTLSLQVLEEPVARTPNRQLFLASFGVVTSRHQKWMNFYTKVLSKFAASAGLKLTLRVEVAPLKGSPRKRSMRPRSVARTGAEGLA